MRKEKFVEGVNGVYSPPKEENDYHLSHKNPPKIKSKEEEINEDKEEPSFLKRLYNKIRNKKEAF